MPPKDLAVPPACASRHRNGDPVAAAVGLVLYPDGLSKDHQGIRYEDTPVAIRIAAAVVALNQGDRSLKSQQRIRCSDGAVACCIATDRCGQRR